MLVCYKFLNSIITMKQNFARDLKAARRRYGLSQADCAHLLKVNQSRISKLEAGTCRPTTFEICALCIVYDETPAQLCRSATAEAIGILRKRISTVPDCTPRWRNRKQRIDTLNDLMHRLAADDTSACAH